MKKEAVVTLSLLLLGVALLALGIYRKECAVVMEKAVRLCMECIGIG